MRKARRYATWGNCHVEPTEKSFFKLLVTVVFLSSLSLSLSSCRHGTEVEQRSNKVKARPPSQDSAQLARHTRNGQIEPDNRKLLPSETLPSIFNLFAMEH